MSCRSQCENYLLQSIPISVRGLWQESESYDNYANSKVLLSQVCLKHSHWMLDGNSCQLFGRWTTDAEVPVKLRHLDAAVKLFSKSKQEPLLLAGCHTQVDGKGLNEQSYQLV